MSTSLLVAKERQPGSPFGLGQKQAKKQKIGRKCATVARYSMLYRFLNKPKNKKIRRKRATVARYSMLYRFLCNAMQRDSVQPGPDLAFGLCCSVPFHNNSWYGLQKHPPPSSGLVSNYLIVLALYRGREVGTIARLYSLLLCLPPVWIVANAVICERTIDRLRTPRCCPLSRRWCRRQARARRA